MKYRRRRRKISNTELLIWVGILVVVLLGSRASSLQSSLIAPVTIGALIVLVGVTAFISWQRGQQVKVRQGLRAMYAEHVDLMTGEEFEHYVGAMLEGRGFRSINYTPWSNDSGVDITATYNNLRYAIQTKRYNRVVYKKDLYPVVSALQTKKYDRAMLVTNQHFTKKLQEHAKEVGCELVDRDELARWRAELN